MIAPLTPYTDAEIAERLAAVRAAEERRRATPAHARASTVDVGAFVRTLDRVSAAQQIAAEVEFARLERASADNALAVERILRQIASGDLSPETDAAADLLFEAGETISARMLELEPLLGRARTRAA